MNTGQLIVLWYGTLAVAGVLVFRALNNESAIYLIASIALVTGVLVYTMRQHPQARKSR